MPKEEWNGPNFHYVVRWRKVGDTEFHEKNITDPYQDHYVVDGTDPYTEYETQVQAVNDKGVSVTSPATIKGFTGQESMNYLPTRV